MRVNLNSKQRGLNLTELMIAIVIGLFISLMVVQYLSTSTKLFKQQGTDTTLEANATFAVSYLSQFIRQAGSNSPTGTITPFFAGDCNGNDPADVEEPCTYNSDIVGKSDQIAIQMVSWNSKDCANQDTDPDERIANVFSVVDSQLLCRGYSVDNDDWLTTEEPISLIDGIEQMQVLYGVSNDVGVIVRYVDASRVAGAWDQVRSVKLALLVSEGADDSGSEKQQARSYQLLDSPKVEYADRVSRKVYTTTITINNMLL